MNDEVSSMTPEDLVAYLHPLDRPDAEHTLAAAWQIRYLLRYLAATATPATATRAHPDPHVTEAMANALRDGMRSAVELFDLLAKRHDQFAGDPQLNAVGDAMGQSAQALANVADYCDEVCRGLDTAATAAAGLNAGTQG